VVVMKRTLGVVVAVVATACGAVGIASAASSPAVATGKVSSVKDESAVLNGTVNPNGASTKYYFQWGRTSSYEVTGTTRSAGSGTKAVSVRQTASGLIPGTVYHYRLVATNKFGTSAGADRTFKTAGNPPPTVTTGPAVNVGRNSATLTGTINPNGQSTAWFFQWGTTSSYGNNTNGGTVAAGRTPVSVAQTETGLQAGTIFHYRLFGTHGGTAASPGADQIFMTEPNVRQRPRMTRRTRPLRARRKPWVFTTTGRVFHPTSIPNQFACTGLVGISYFNGRKRVKFALVPLQANCTYRAQFTFKRKPGRGPRNRIVTLHVVVHFRGNGYIAPAYARPQTVTLR
jgi:hypothetical protein